MKSRIQTLISAISENMYEREHIIALSLLAGVAGANTFLYGAPGTAKSLISRRIATAFEVNAYFEYLMNRFSTPEEIFGPVSIKALKQDQYIRKTEHYLPRADFAFLDEIWKASPAILNTLLTLVNEKTFKNGEAVQQVPLKVLISASNEIPEPNQGLDALYDRFILRLQVQPIAQASNFHALLQAKPSAVNIKVERDLKISAQELLQWREQMYQVQLSDTVLKVFDEIKQRLQFSYDDHQVYVSDRRWQRVAYLVKAAAFLNDRDEVLLTDLYLLKHCLWNQVEDQDFVHQVVNQSIEQIGLDSDLNLTGLIEQKEKLEQDILNSVYYTDDVYESYLINDIEYLRAVTNLDHHYQDKVLYLELNKMGTKKDFFAVDASGQEVRGIVCNFNGSRLCTLKGGYYGLEEVVTPYIKYTKGTLRTTITAQRKYDLLQQVLSLKTALADASNTLQMRIAEYEPQVDSVFVHGHEIEQFKQQLNAKQQTYALHIQDTLRLEQLCRD
ncbi:AAA family ATPase [Acinetobacter lanii]|uniref:AAA domain-containing protein n=1 Tax=Acinetobacter lanii TaxID=2715163 RepID=A0A6G8S5J2_9GAMM|nr:AAA family ATPase [Acinetobacter lanii]QIO09506.1 AAA domain-containing protein [Acinetobacter lanii]